MSDEEILALIHAALRNTLPHRAAEFEKVTLDDELRSLAIGSLAVMEMVSYLEDELATTFRGEDMAKVVRLRDLAGLIRAARAAA
jgi:acyl carrier protein